MNEILFEIKEYMSSAQIARFCSLANAFKTIFAALGCFVAYKAVKIILVRRKYAHIPGPPTSGVLRFFVGNFPTISQMEKDGKMLIDYMLDWHKQYGPVLKFQILDEIIISTIEPESIKEVLVVKNFPKATSFFKPIIKPWNIRMVGNGLITDPDNKHWREQRSFFNPGFHRNVLMNFVQEFNQKTDLLMERLRTLADGKTSFKLFPELNHTALDAIASIAFGMHLDSINNEKDRLFSDYLDELLQIVGDLFLNPWALYSPHYIPRMFRFRKIITFLRETGKKKILERLNEGSVDQNDILAGILKGSKSGCVDLELMIDNFITFFIAGQETTSNALGFCFIEMGRNKTIFEKCREEIDTVLGSRTEITYEDISKLKYIGCVFKESLRLYPPGPVISRMATEEMKICGFTIPANTPISLPTYITSRLESNFPNCTEFRPERFMKDSDSMETKMSNYTYFPFSIGPRSCIGQNFAQIEGIIILAKFIQKFDYSLAPDQSFQILLALTMKPKDGTKIILSLRN